ncbi:MAG TPA: glutamate 5-kinase, partial [Pseudolabrys sp.]|nr:glutamate 5-kinase [Pseudolabrys sp.]
MPKVPTLSAFRRVVVKVGSSLLVDQAAGLKHAWLDSLAADIAGLHKDKDVLVVSSGAIALGRAVLKLPPGTLKLEEAQAAAAVGQIALAR